MQTNDRSNTHCKNGRAIAVAMLTTIIEGNGISLNNISGLSLRYLSTSSKETKTIDIRISIQSSLPAPVSHLGNVGSLIKPSVPLSTSSSYAADKILFIFMEWLNKQKIKKYSFLLCLFDNKCIIIAYPPFSFISLIMLLPRCSSKEKNN